MITITKERLLTIKQWRETYGPGSNVVLPAEEAEELARIALAALEREQIRHEHAKWSDSTFGCVGPIGPLKHLSKEALEAAAEPDDLSEWADMQFLLWDAQRRAGISDAGPYLTPLTCRSNQRRKLSTQTETKSRGYSRS